MYNGLGEPRIFAKQVPKVPKLSNYRYMCIIAILTLRSYNIIWISILWKNVQRNQMQYLTKNHIDYQRLFSPSYFIFHKEKPKLFKLCCRRINS